MNTYLILGGSSGIGLAVSRKLAKENDIVIVSHSEKSDNPLFYEPGVRLAGSFSKMDRASDLPVQKSDIPLFFRYFSNDWT